MLSGWYCRTLANEQAAQQTEMDSTEDDDESGTAKSASDHKAHYRYLKRKLKYLIYENEFFQDALRSNQRRLLKVTRDRTFLLDRLLQYEKPENTSSESDTESSEDDALKDAKKRKVEPGSSAANSSSGAGGGSTRGRKKKVVPAVAAEVAAPAEKPTSEIPPIEQQQQQQQLPTPKQALPEDAALLLGQYGNCLPIEYNQ